MLGLIQYWSDAFKGKPQLDAVEDMYNQMKSEGVEFPPIDLDALAPIETPSGRVSPSVAAYCCHSILFCLLLLVLFFK